MKIKKIKAKSKIGNKELYEFSQLVDFHLHYSLGLSVKRANAHDWLNALSLAVRNYLIDSMAETENRYHKADSKRLCYFSMEFLMGRLLYNNLANLKMEDIARTVLDAHGIELSDIEESEADSALGNGGLGRLAACFLDSLATLDMPGFGYGINYEYGLFRQVINNGRQEELPDHWQHEKAPWLLERNHDECRVPLYGRLEQHGMNLVWIDYRELIGLPFDMPIVGYGGRTVNFLRLYSARSSHSFDMQIFNSGEYINAVEQKISSETVSKVLYPSDSCWNGKELRLIQEYFLVSCAVQDIIKHHKQRHGFLDNFADKIAIQLNDTHPALTVAELMRIFLDEYHMPWQEAWTITQATCAYTNHTLLPEALEVWPVSLLTQVLPRHMQIIYEINYHFLQQVMARWPGEDRCACTLSLIQEGHEKQVRMAHLAIVGSHSINGVAELHTQLIKNELVPDFYTLWPERFNNKTNGVTPRRWIAQANPVLTQLINDTLGNDQWLTDLNQLRALEDHVQDTGFVEQFSAIKQQNKRRLVQFIAQKSTLHCDPDSLFAVQIKRIHEYKRQLLNILRVMHLYLKIVEEGQDLPVPQTYIFAGKAAPGYVMAKLIIKLINNVADMVNNDSRANQQLKVVFLPDYRVSLAEKIIPATNLSEQISTAGTEASGTGNMKFAMNGALTIGTLDGANVEMREEVGVENFYIFGLTVNEVSKMREHKTYHTWDYYHRSPLIRQVLDSLIDNRFSANEPDIFRPIYNNLMYDGDYFYHLADFEAYIKVHEQAALDYQNHFTWNQKAILNMARMGKFSSDRTVREYAKDIWHIQAV